MFNSILSRAALAAAAPALLAAAPALLAAGLTSSPAVAEETAAPEGAAVYFIAPEDGASLASPVVVRFGLKGMGVAPAGTEKAKTGHHHVFIDRAPFGEDDVGVAIPADDNHKHFGGGQTETSLTLAPGEHRLQLVLGDHDHIPHAPPVVSEVITITVK